MWQLAGLPSAVPPTTSSSLPVAGRPRQPAWSRRRGAAAVRDSTSSFEELRTVASEAVASAQSKLPLLEQVKNTAERAKEPAADAERVWQDAHAKLTGLQQEVANVMKSLREDVTTASGGEADATHALLKRHVSERLEHYRINHSLVIAIDWKVYAPRDLPLHSIPGGRFVYQLAASEHDGTCYAVVGLAISNPFLVDNLRSLLLHWGCSEGAHAGWAQPPKGWLTSPGVSTPAGNLAWETVFGTFAPVMQGEPVLDAASCSVVLQVPLEGVLELQGGIKCVLKRTDGGQPEWIKAGPHNNGDFFLDFAPVINHFEHKRRKAQAAALAHARAAGLLEEEEEEEEEEVGHDAPVAVKNLEGLGTNDSGDAPSANGAKATAAKGKAAKKEKAKAKVEELPPLPEEEPPYNPHLPEWVHSVEQFVQLSDLPQDRSMALHLKCFSALATAIAEAGGPNSIEARTLLQRCCEAESLLHQHDLAELSSRAAQEEKEQLQAIFRSASDESSHLMQELVSEAEAARRTTIKLRGRETEVTQRDLEVVAQQTAQELLKKSIGGIWHFKEERQLVFVQQKVMEVAGMDAAVVVQVYVEGTKATVQAGTALPAATNSSFINRATSSADGLASTDGSDGKEKGAAANKEGKKKEEQPPPTFDHVVVGIAVAEEFPDGRLSTPLIMHMGLVAHQHAKWQSPPDKWACLPESVQLSASGSAMQVAFQRYSIRAEDGAPVFVDPTLFALALRVPLRDCLERGVRGVEFVLKTSDGTWRSWKQNHGQSCNFYAELPLPIP